MCIKGLRLVTVQLPEKSWLIGPGEWAIRVELFSLGVDAWASLMGHTEERGDSDVKRGT